ncbi:unnamed protein product [Diamesa tonsa]
MDTPINTAGSIKKDMMKPRPTTDNDEIDRSYEIIDKSELNVNAPEFVFGSKFTMRTIPTAPKVEAIPIVVPVVPIVPIVPVLPTAPIVETVIPTPTIEKIVTPKVETTPKVEFTPKVETITKVETAPIVNPVVATATKDADNSNNNTLVVEAENSVADVAEVEDNDDNNNHDEETTESTSIDNERSRKYSREQLMSIKQKITPHVEPELDPYVKNALFKQENNQFEEILVKNFKVDAFNNLMKFIQPNRNTYQKRNSEQAGGMGGRRSQQGNNANRSSSQIKISLQSNEEVKLNEAENAWKPGAINADGELTEDEQKTLLVFKEFRSVLNKITPENFTVLMGQIKLLEVNTVERLDGCIKLVFEKAISEPNFATSYALMCKEISSVFVVDVKTTGDKTQKAMFKNRLITNCQLEFEKHRDSEIVKNNVQRLEEIENEEDPTKKKALEQAFEEENFKLRHRAVGTVHFIGELFKINMLTSKIMVHCIVMLMDRSVCSEETLECLCKLLSTIGKQLEKMDNDKKENDLTPTFNALKNIADKKQLNKLQISSRIRFMIQDVIDLRLNNWTPRRVEVKPKTIVQIEKEAELEHFMSQSLRKDDNNRSGSRGNFNNNMNNNNPNNKRGGGMVNEDGWSTQQGKNSRPVPLDFKKIATPVPSGGAEIKLGSSTIGGYMNNNSNNNSNNNNNRKGGNGNNNYNRQQSAGSRSLQPPTSPQNQQNKQFGNNNRNNNNNSNNNRYQNNNSNNNSNSFRSELPMKSNTLPRKQSAPARPQTDISGLQYQTEKKVTKTDEVFLEIKKQLELFENEELTVGAAVEKLQVCKIDEKVLMEIYIWGLDQHDKTRFMLTELLCEGVSRQLILTGNVLSALETILESASDHVCDAPLFYTYFSQYLSLPLLKRIIHVKDWLKITDMEIKAEKGGVHVKETFKTFEKKYGKDSLCQLYDEANINFQQFLCENEKLEEFLKTNNFDYLINKAPRAVAAVTMDLNGVQKHIKDMMKSKSETESIIAWINANYPSTKDDEFIKALTTTVLEHCRDNNDIANVNKTHLETFSPLLLKYLQNEPQRQLVCLYTIQKLVTHWEHPSGMINAALSVLYDSDTISRDVLFTWRDSTDAHEQEGKGVVLRSCTVLFKFLEDEINDENNEDDVSSGDEN